MLRVGLLGCTGAVGQQFIRLLRGHAQFDLVVVAASDRSAGQALSAVCGWKLASASGCDGVPREFESLIVQQCQPDEFVKAGVRLVFSALSADVANEVEPQFVAAGIAVFSNASSFRRHPLVPLVVPFVNPQHICVVRRQQERRCFTSGTSSSDSSSSKGFLVTNANCSTTGLVVALKPLADAFGLSLVHVTTLQAISGAGFTGLAAMDIMDNVIPLIGGEEEKLEWEPRKILGRVAAGEGDAHESGDSFELLDMKLSAQCNRVPVIDGHTLCVSLKFATQPPPSVEQVIECLQQFTVPEHVAELPSMRGVQALQVLPQDNRPQPRLDRDRGGGLTVTVGRVRACPINDVRFVVLSHNTVLGAAGSSLLNAEYAMANGYFRD